MPIRPCPRCHRLTARWLEESSKHAYVNYYRCDGCGMVWNVPKENPDAPIKQVTRDVPPKD
jgi:Pyruvate/2-oxoacid:ferredoxin oxidoreductase delta subunit